MPILPAWRDTAQQPGQNPWTPPVAYLEATQAKAFYETVPLFAAMAFVGWLAFRWVRGGLRR